MRPVAIQFALANTRGQVSASQVYSYIESATDYVETYEAARPQPGTYAKAAIDYALVIGIVGSIASIASLIWMAYEKFIVPIRTSDNDAGIILVIHRDDHTYDHFWIGKLHKDQELFIHEFTLAVTRIRGSSDSGESTQRIVEELRTSTTWVRRK